MDPFEKAAQGVVGGFDDAAAQVVDNQQSGLRNTLYDALMSNPDMAARATKLGRQTGLAPELVERNLPEIERGARLDKLDALPKENPFLAAWLSDPANARIAHDDLDTLDLISKSALIRQPAVPKLSEGYGFSQASRDIRAAQQRSESAVGQYVDRNMPASEIFGRERSMTEGITEPFMRGLARGRRGITLLMGMAGLYEGDDAGLAVRLAQQNRQAEAYPIPENVQAGSQAISEAEGFGDAAWAILSNPGAVKETVIESIGVSAPSLLAAGALSTFGPAGTAAGAGLGSFAVEYGATIQDVIAQNGVNASDPLEIHAALNDPDIMAAAKEKALARGVPIAMFDALTAGFAGKLLAGAKNTTASAATRTAGELGIQAAGGGAGEATAQALTDEFKPGEILLEAIAELPTGLIEIPANYQHARAKAARADDNAKSIEEINNFAKTAKVLQRDPETFQSFIAAAAEDGPVQNVFIDGRTLLQSGMATSVAELSPAVREQLDRSLLTGGMIAIPVDEYAARIAPTEFAPQLLDHLKTDPEGFSRTEAADFMANQGAELQAEVERVIGNQAGADAFRTSQDVVTQDILDQLNATWKRGQAGGRPNSPKAWLNARDHEKVNEVFATLVGTRTAIRAAQMGITPEEFHQRYGMKVQGEAVAGQQFSQGVTLDAVRQQWDSAGIKSAISENNGAITLSQIVVPESERGAGKGTAAMQSLVDYADRTGQRVMLTPSADFGGNKKRLTEFYKRFGFVENKGKNKDFSTMERMIREPKEAANSMLGGANANPDQPTASGASVAQSDPNILNQSANGSKEIAVTRLDSVFEGDHLKQAEQFYKQNVQGKTVDNPGIGEVRFSAEGLGKLLSGNRESALRASVVKVLPELMANAELTDLDIDRKWRGHVDGFKYLIAPMEHDGKLYAVRMTVKQGQQGGSFYTLEGFKADTLSAIGGQNSSYPGSEGTSSLNPTVRLDFLETEVNELNRVFQPDGAGPRGAFSPATNTVTLLQSADLSTFLHESAHYFFESDIRLASELLGKPDLTSGEQQIVDDVGKLLTWHGIQGDVTEQLRQWHTMDFEEQRSHHERTAESFEAYLFSGKAPNLELQAIFQRFRAWMVNVYKSITDFVKKNPEAGKLNDEVRSVFDRMIATQEQIQLAEQARSLTALFASPETSGMTPEAYAAYQALDVDATNTAIEELQAKGLRDMQWLTNAKGRAVKKLQKESKAVRAEITMEARREVMSQPVYRAWDFLTGKSGEKTDAQTQNELEVADWKQRRQEAMDAARAQAKTEAWDNSDESRQEYDSGRAKGMAKGQLLARQKKDIDLIVARAALDWDRANPRPVAAQDSNVFDLGEQVFGKINRAALEDIGVPEEITAHIRNLRMTAADGMHPDQIAEMFEFSSGDEMVRTLAAAPTPKDAINALAEQMMLERHGELASPDAIERAADQAIHNDVRARMIATEVNALAKAIGKPKILSSAAKAFAADMIARLKIRDIRPGQYANAEARASKAADKAHKAGDTALAASEKRNQIIQHYATRAAYDAQDEVKAGLRYLKKFDKRSKTIDPEYQDQIEAMLERFELRAISNKAVDRRASLAQWLTAQREAGLEPDIDPKLENEAFRTSYKNITVEEFRGLVDAVKQIEHLGRLKNKLLTAQDQRAFRAIVEEVAGSIVDNGGKARKVELETPKGIRPWLEGVAAGHRKIASLIRQMDGLKDGGPFWRVLVRGMNEASTNETVMIEQATVKLAELYKPMLALKGGLNGDLRSIPEIGDSLTRGGRLSVALNWGNAANRQRVMDGDQWSEQQVHAILKTLTREEWAFVQNVWAFIDSYWPAIEAKEKRVTGRAPDKVAAEPFSYMVDGEMVSLTGGYYPIKYDSNRDDKAEKHDAAAIAQDMMRGAMTRSTTRRGHTKARMESVNRPVKKTLDVITQHVSEVTHDLAWHEWLVDANRLLDAKPINQAIRDYYGTEVLRTMKDALTSIATADIVPQDAMDRAILYLRANVSRSTMGMSLTTAFLQPFGLLQSMVRIGPKHVLRGVARWGGDAARFESSMTWIGEKSDFMRLRSKTFNRELHEIKGRVNHGHSKARTIYDASLFMLMQKMQMVADVPTWIGAYERAIDAGNDDATAVALADQSVLDSQGGGQTKDMAQFQKKHPIWTMFYSYFNTTLNLAAESTAATNFKNPLAVAGWLSDMALLMVIPALAPAMILAFMKGGGCDDAEDCAKKLAEAQAGYLLGLMLGVRELSGVVSGFDYSGPPVGRVFTELERAGTQIGQGEADEAAAMSAISLLGVTLGIPTVQILRSYRGWVAWEDGEAPATSVLMGPPPKD